MNSLSPKGHILIVDDDPGHRVAFARRLTIEGYSVSECGLGRDAIRLTQTTPVELVLLDIELPDISGFEVLERIRDQFTLIQLPVIMLTGSFESRIMVEALKKGANDYVTKPADFPVAAARIRTHLTIRRQEAELEDRRARSVASAKLLALGELAAGAAHEIYNPLTVICGTASRLEQIAAKNEGSTEIAKLAQRIQSGAQRITKIVKAIDHFSQTADKNSLVPSAPEQFIEEAVLLSHPRLKNGAVTLLLPESYPAVKVLCRPYEMAQAIYNLLSNASDAVQNLEERWVRIQVEVTDEEVAISVIDSGSEKREEVLNKMFQPFFTTKPVDQGTGLGLSQALGIVRSAQGKLEIDRASRNTTFVIRLPRLATAAAA